MKKVLLFSNILTWFNMVVTSIFVLLVLTMIGKTVDLLTGLTTAVLMGSIALHSYAAMQLRKSILQPQVRLEKNTPVGIKFIGYLVLLIGFLLIVNSVSVLQNTKQILGAVKIPEEAKNMNIEGIFKGFVLFLFMYGVSIVLNVLMNLRLLRAYQIINQDQTTGRNN